MGEGVVTSGTAWINLAESERIARREGEKGRSGEKRADQSIAAARSLFTATVEKEKSSGCGAPVNVGYKLRATHIRATSDGV